MKTVINKVPQPPKFELILHLEQGEVLILAKLLRDALKIGLSERDLKRFPLTPPERTILLSIYSELEESKFLSL